MDPSARATTLLQALRASGRERDEAVRRLRALLLRTARGELRRRCPGANGDGSEFNEIASRAADAALAAVLARLDEFCGRSRFTTWACKFVILEVSARLGREYWRANPSGLDAAHVDSLADELLLGQEQPVEEHRPALAALRTSLDRDLTDRERIVFVAIALGRYPIEAVAAQLGTDRGAVYGTLFDARTKLRRSLARAGYAIGRRG